MEATVEDVEVIIVATVLAQHVAVAPAEKAGAA